ncbi:MAG: YjbH domain-containing protein [Fuscovulum sp.]|nr:YjbH domain-containing protein [Fuscovulum sp.]
MSKVLRQRASLKGAACLACALSGPAMAEIGAPAWGYNSYGIPGMIDMPTAFGREDAELGFMVSHFRNTTRTTLTFQISDRLSASFRYSFLYDLRSRPNTTKIFPYIFDRSFSVQYRFIDEGRVRPAFSVGINDLVGTGIYAGEYVVASKTLTPRLRASLGIGWGRLGSFGSFKNPLSLISESFTTRSTDRGAEGGTFEPQTWFHGPAAMFGGIEWQATDRLRVVLEYSSDDYAREDGTAFDRKSPLNFGVTYQVNDRVSVAASYLYGSEVGVQLTYALNPKAPRFGSGLDPAPPPVFRRTAEALGGQPWLALDDAGMPDEIGAALAAEGLALDGFEVSGKTLRIQIRNDRYGIAAQATGRAARVLTRLAPVGVDTFEIRLAAQGVPVTSVTLRRSDLEELEFHPVAPDLLRSRTMIRDQTASLPPVDGRYPILTYGIGPYFTPSLFDPDAPLRADVGAVLWGRAELVPGLVLSGRVQQKLAGNLDTATRVSDSVLPHVRSDASLYFKGGSTTIPELTASFFFRPGKDLFGRVTLGYLESMFGGVSTELLWKPQNSRIALGAELNYVKQRDFDQMFGFQDYSVATGHLSAYYDFGRGYTGQLDVGRYLAGDRGATLTLAREFDNGWKIGAYATITDVSAEEFGEGSFDKGIIITVPIDWVTGKPLKTRYSTVIRPIQRDGGARLYVSDRLYETVRGLQATEMDGTWGRFWK